MEVSEIGVSLAGGESSVSADTTTTVFDGLTLVVLDESNDRPLMVSDVLDGSNTTPGGFLGRTDFPGWLINVQDGLAGDENADRYLDLRSTPPDTIRSVGEPNLDWQSGSATGEMYGKYRIIFDDTEYGPGRMFSIDPLNPDATRQALEASLGLRLEAGTTNVDAATANLVGVAPEDLVQVSVPFRVVNLTNDPATEVQLAMLASSKLDSITLGSGLVTLRAAVPADVWVPEEPLIFIETLQDVPLRGVYDGTEYYLQDGGGNLIIGDTTVVTWTDVQLGCAEPATGCNPIAGDVATPGATGHIPFTANQALEIEFLNPFTSLTQYVFAIDPAVAGIDVTEVSDSAIAEIKVVPNPYVVWSEFEQLGNQNPRLMFTGLLGSSSSGSATMRTTSWAWVTCSGICGHVRATL